jgi:peptide deformylase
MAILKVLLYPNPFLRTKAKPVTKIDATVRQYIDDMLETMYADKGVGLAATQVGIPLRIFTMDTSGEYNQPKVLINPEITQREGEKTVSEACLSFPGITIEVARAEKVWVKALNADGQVYEFAAEGVEAQCVQHELDHLDGIIFTDHLSKLKRERANKKTLKMLRAHGLDNPAKEAS